MSGVDMSPLQYLLAFVALLIAVIMGCAGVHLLILAHEVNAITVMGVVDLTGALSMAAVVLSWIIREAVATAIEDSRL